ncbi:MAG: tRNA (adenosine(37)-N6)-threonylcarbamoyltransferase complex transferase subunit TsaD [Clostridiales Family XIII bacterium]|nr:tRNA (adenosine(37)-N6)-threonylcarbamoyltransferase complex transferase subunit TsaD [Clostridiales Family XIII bacterium]
MEKNEVKDGKFLTLGIESSCDETAASVVADGREVLSNVIASQIDIHKVFGGVVPEIASRHHLTAINFVTEQAIAESGASMEEIDLVAVTEGPGLIGAVLIGLASAKALAYATGKPLVGVHHIKGHIAAAYLEGLDSGSKAGMTNDLEPPFLSLVVSGGHTSLIEVKNYCEMNLLGSTRDDAVGEAYDKVARVLGLGYPGGPKVDALAKEGNPSAIDFKRVLLEKGSLDFSFSGIKTGVINYINSAKQAGREIAAADVAASFQQSVIDVLVIKTMEALKQTGHRTLTLSGGVASNSALRGIMKENCEKAGIELVIPSPIFCTDNAAMIACAGYYKYGSEGADGLDMDAHAVLSL